MPTVKPFFPSDSLLKLEFYINGENTGLDNLLRDATIQFELNRIPLAKFSFVSSQKNIDSDEVLPIESLSRNPADAPLEIEVKIGFEKQMETIFKGIVRSLDKHI